MWATWTSPGSSSTDESVADRVLDPRNRRRPATRTVKKRHSRAIPAPYSGGGLTPAARTLDPDGRRTPCISAPRADQLADKFDEQLAFDTIGLQRAAPAGQVDDGVG
jgi:hypothetical protein